MEFEYEPDEKPKKKHHWAREEAGFVAEHGHEVGKCPSKLGLALASQLLNSGVPWQPAGWRRDYPKRIYVVFEGVLYRATPTNPGRSYHGFPEHPTLFPVGAQSTRRAIIELARSQDCEEEVRSWMNW